MLILAQEAEQGPQQGPQQEKIHPLKNKKPYETIFF
jgi:hypothetical protein